MKFMKNCDLIINCEYKKFIKLQVRLVYLLIPKVKLHQSNLVTDNQLYQFSKVTKLIQLHMEMSLVPFYSIMANQYIKRKKLDLIKEK